MFGALGSVGIVLSSSLPLSRTILVSFSPPSCLDTNASIWRALSAGDEASLSCCLCHGPGSQPHRWGLWPRPRALRVEEVMGSSEVGALLARGSSTPPGTDPGSPQFPPAFCLGVGTSPMSPPLGPGLWQLLCSQLASPSAWTVRVRRPQSWKMEPLSKSVDWELICLGGVCHQLCSQNLPPSPPLPLAPF